MSEMTVIIIIITGCTVAQALC